MAFLLLRHYWDCSIQDEEGRLWQFSRILLWSHGPSKNIFQMGQYQLCLPWNYGSCGWLHAGFWIHRFGSPVRGTNFDLILIMCNLNHVVTLDISDGLWSEFTWIEHKSSFTIWVNMDFREWHFSCNFVWNH